MDSVGEKGQTSPRRSLLQDNDGGLASGKIQIRCTGRWPKGTPYTQNGVGLRGGEVLEEKGFGSPIASQHW